MRHLLLVSRRPSNSLSVSHHGVLRVIKDDQRNGREPPQEAVQDMQEQVPRGMSVQGKLFFYASPLSITGHIANRVRCSVVQLEPLIKLPTLSIRDYSVVGQLRNAGVPRSIRMKMYC